MIESFRKEYGAPVWVAMEYRYMPPMQKFLEMADDVTDGIRMLSIVEHRYPFLEKVGNWNRFNANSGGTFVEKCCHFFDLMRLILKSDPVQVMASAGQEVNHLDEVYDGRTSDIWDSGYVIVDFASGARGIPRISLMRRSPADAIAVQIVPSRRSAASGRPARLPASWRAPGESSRVQA